MENIDVPLPPVCTIATVGDVAPLLRDALDSGESVTLDLSGLESCDFSFVQMVEAGRRMAARDGKILILAQPAPPPVAAILARAGFAGPDAGPDIAFWHHGVLPQ